MTLRSITVAVGWVAIIGAGTYVQAQQPSQALDAEGSPQPRALLERYCITCHNERLQAQGTVPVSFHALDLADVSGNAEVLEKTVRKLRGGMMPPVGRPRPDKATNDGFIAWLETELDRAATARPNPGSDETYHRLNRAEYENAVRDLLGIEVDVAALLPVDDSSYGFDNIAGVLRFSPTLMERYLTAAKKVSRLAVGTPPAFPNFEVFRLVDDFRQDDRIEGLPFGTRGGTIIPYNFPVDGEYDIRVKLARQTGTNDRDIPRFTQPQQLEVSLDGERLQLFTLAASVPPAEADERQQPPPDTLLDDRSALDVEWTVRIPVEAGPRDIQVTFVTQTPALLETWVEPYDKPHSSGGGNLWGTRKRGLSRERGDQWSVRCHGARGHAQSAPHLCVSPGESRR